PLHEDFQTPNGSDACGIPGPALAAQVLYQSMSASVQETPEIAGKIPTTGHPNEHYLPRRNLTMKTHGITPRTLTAFGFLAVLCVTALLPARAQQSPAAPAGAGRGDGDKPGQADPAKEIEKLKEEILQLKAQIGELRTKSKALENHLLFAPGL